MTDAACPEAGKHIVDLAAICGRVVVARGAFDDARVLFEVAVRRKGHPVGIEVCCSSAHDLQSSSMNGAISVFRAAMLNNCLGSARISH